MAKTVKGARFVLKRSNVSGESPTVPPNNDHTTGWIDTDIYVGELFLNIHDNKMWFRDTANDMIGLVPLNSGGTIDPSYLPANPAGALVYRGVWDASTGNPPTSTPEKGDYYIVNASGNTNLDGITDWQIGDFPVYNGATWDKIDNSEPEISAVNVLYTHSYYSGLTNAAESFDFLLDRFNYYSGSTNVTVTDDGSGHGKTISLATHPDIAGNLTVQGVIIGNDDVELSNHLKVSGTTNLYGNLTSTGAIVADTLQSTTGEIYFNVLSSKIVSDGSSMRFYQSGIGLSLEFNNSTGIATTYSKMRYDVTGKTFDDNRDFVDKGYLDQQIGLHNVGLWSSGGTLLNDPYKIIAWDGVNTHYIGVNVQNPLYNLDINGNACINDNGDKFLFINPSGNLVQIGDIDGISDENYLELNTSTGTMAYYGASGSNVFNVYKTGDVELEGKMWLNSISHPSTPTTPNGYLYVGPYDGTSYNLWFIDDAGRQSQLSGDGGATPGGNSKDIQFNGGGNTFSGTTNFTWDNTNRIMKIISPTATQGEGTAQLGQVNYVSSNTETSYLYSGFVHAANGWAIPQDSGDGGLATVMKHYKFGNTTYEYSHIYVESRGLRTKHNVNSVDSTAAAGGTWRVYPYLTNTLLNNYIMTGVNGYSMQSESGLQYNGSTLTVTGAITATGNITAYFSDIRLKTNIEKIENSLDKILSLEGFTYTLNDLAKELNPVVKDEQQTGLSAQDVQKVLPEVVKPAPFDVDIETGESKSGENYLTIQYEKLVPLLIEGIKEQQKLIEELQNKLK